MKRLIIVCEGQTEQSFCHDVLQPYFAPKNIFIDYPTTKKSQGGIVRWDALRFQVEKHLREDPKAFVTTLIDYYGLYANHGYPNWEAVQEYNNKDYALGQIETGMVNGITPNLQTRFIPYIQLHEFEGLLFSDISAFEALFEEYEFADFAFLQQTISAFPDPEQINQGRETAPSKRLKRILPGYSKISTGALLAEHIGLATIREKCPRFNQWITRLERL